MSLGFDVYFVVMAGFQSLPLLCLLLHSMLPSSRAKKARAFLEEVAAMILDIEEKGISIDEDTLKRYHQ